MPPIYRIHPGIGIARLGNSPDDFCISPEEPAALPIECDGDGNPVLVDGKEKRIETFKDEKGRIKRQAARFQVWVYDEQSPDGRPLQLHDQVEGGGNAGELVNIQWRVYLANKKAVWYEFKQLEGEHGYAGDHPRRNAAITGDEARQRLIIDPGPRTVDIDNTRASFDRDGGGAYATTFPPPLQPEPIDSLGDILFDKEGRLLVLGGFGASGSYRFDEFGQPRIDEYANNDGWFDDTADGPVMARLVMKSPLVDRLRYVDVEYPAWTIVGYPAYVPEILDVVTLDDVVQDMAVREFAERTDLYGTSGTFASPQHIPPMDEEALILWRAGRLEWNPEHRPWFYRDIWTILFRPDQYNYLCDVLGLSNYPHNQSTRGTFDPFKLGVPPKVDWDAVARGVTACMRRNHSGELLVEAIAPALAVLEKPAKNVRFARAAVAAKAVPLSERLAGALGSALRAYTQAVFGDSPGNDYAAYLARWRDGAQTPEAAQARSKLDEEVKKALDDASAGLSAENARRLREVTHDHLRRYLTGQLLQGCRARLIEASTEDPYAHMRHYLFSLLRQHGEENDFFLGDKPSSRVHNLPLMPLLAGDNPISNKVPSKFLRLTDYQYFLLRQWSLGFFYNEELEGWGEPDPLAPLRRLGEPHRPRPRPRRARQPARRRLLSRRRGGLGDPQPVGLSRAVPHQGRSRLLRVRADGGAGQHRLGVRRRLRRLRRRRPQPGQQLRRRPAAGRRHQVHRAALAVGLQRVLDPAHRHHLRAVEPDRSRGRPRQPDEAAAARVADALVAGAPAAADLRAALGLRQGRRHRLARLVAGRAADERGRPQDGHRVVAAALRSPQPLAATAGRRADRGAAAAESAVHQRRAHEARRRQASQAQ